MCDLKGCSNDTDVALPSKLQAVFVAEIDTNEVLFIALVPTDDSVGLDHERSLKNHTRRGHGDMMASEESLIQARNIWCISPTNVLEAFPYGLAGIAGTKGFGKHSESFCCCERLPCVEILNAVNEMRVEIVGVHEAVS